MRSSFQPFDPVCIARVRWRFVASLPRALWRGVVVFMGLWVGGLIGMSYCSGCMPAMARSLAASVRA